MKATFEGDLRFEFHLAPPLLGRRDPHTGLPVKSTFGPRMIVLFRGLAALKGLRVAMFDIFGHTQERREKRKLIGDYEALLAQLRAPTPVVPIAAE